MENVGFGLVGAVVVVLGLAILFAKIVERNINRPFDDRE